MGLLDGMAQWPIGIDFIVVAAADPGSRHVAPTHEIGDNRLGGALGDSDLSGDVPAAHSWVAGDTHEHVAVVGEKRPIRPRRVFRLLAWARHVLNGISLREIPVGS